MNSLWAMSGYLRKTNKRVTQQQRANGQSSDTLSSKNNSGSKSREKDGFVDFQGYSTRTSGSGPWCRAPAFQIHKGQFPRTQAWRRQAMCRPGVAGLYHKEHGQQWQGQGHEDHKKTPQFSCLNIISPLFFSPLKQKSVKIEKKMHWNSWGLLKETMKC